MYSRSSSSNDSEPQGQKTVRFAAESSDRSTSAIDSKEDTIIRMLNQLMDGQNRLMDRMNSLENEVDKIKKNVVDLEKNNGRQFKKVNTDLFKIGFRTGQIKDLAIKTAANTLNNARKLHGAKSVLDPVKQFNEGGYRDWSIRPENHISNQSFNIPTRPVKKSRYSVMNASGEQNVYSRQESRTPGYSPESPVYQEGNGYQGNKTPAYKQNVCEQKGNRTPAYSPVSPIYQEKDSNQEHRIPAYQNVYPMHGNRSPVYSPESPDYRGNKTPVYQGSTSPSYTVNETEDHWHLNSNRPECSSRMNRSINSSSGAKYGGARYEPYKNDNNLNRTFPKARRDESAYEPSYEPESPVFED